MSKGSLFWANASGKLGETVLYRSGGEQRTRTYVAKIKNPKTLAQMNNRLLMNNLVSSFRVLKPLMQQTFPTKKSNQSAFNAFVQANKNMQGYYISKQDLEAGACVPYGLTISKGNLGITIEPKMYKEINEADRDAAPKYGYVVNGLLDLSNFELTVDDSRSGDPHLELTPEEVYQVFKQCSTIALPSEFQLTIVGADYGAEDADLNTDLWQPGYKVYHCQQFGSYVRSYNMTGMEWLFTISLRISSHVYNEAENTYTYKFDALLINRTLASPNDLANVTAGLILSFKDASGNQVSTSKMSSLPARFEGEPVEDVTADYKRGGFYYEQVLSEYGYTQDGVLASTVPNVDPNASTDGGNDDDVVVEED